MFKYCFKVVHTLINKWFFVPKGLIIHIKKTTKVTPTTPTEKVTMLRGGREEEG